MRYPYTSSKNIIQTINTLLNLHDELGADHVLYLKDCDEEYGVYIRKIAACENYIDIFITYNAPCYSISEFALRLLLKNTKKIDRVLVRSCYIENSWTWFEITPDSQLNYFTETNSNLLIEMLKEFLIELNGLIDGAEKVENINNSHNYDEPEL